MQDLNDLYYFVKVVDHGGFAPAARALGIPKSRLSRRISQLEERLSVRLIQRSTRSFSVTAVGQDYYRHCVAMLVEAEAAQEVIDQLQAEPRGVLKVSCPPALVCFGVGAMIADFMTQYPGACVHLDSTSRRVDVITEGIDIAIRVRVPPLDDSDLMIKVLAPSPQRLLANPDLMGKLKTPIVPADLGNLPSIDFAPAHRAHQWCLDGPGGATALIGHNPRLVTDDMIFMRIAALAGVGVVQLPDMMVTDDLTSGRLVDVIPDWRPRGGLVHAVFASRRGLLPAVRALLDHLAKAFASPPNVARP